MTRAELDHAIRHALATGGARFYDQDRRMVAPANARKASVIAFQAGFLDWNDPDLALTVSELLRGLVGRAIPIVVGFPSQGSRFVPMGTVIDPPPVSEEDMPANTIRG